MQMDFLGYGLQRETALFLQKPSVARIVSTIYNKKAVLSQRWPRDARYI